FVVVGDGEADLLEVVGALHAAGGLAHFLHGRQQQADQNRNNGDHHQQLDQGKRPTGEGRTRFSARADMTMNHCRFSLCWNHFSSFRSYWPAAGLATTSTASGLCSSDAYLASIVGSGMGLRR